MVQRLTVAIDLSCWLTRAANCRFIEIVDDGGLFIPIDVVVFAKKKLIDEFTGSSISLLTYAKFNCNFGDLESGNRSVSPSQLS